MAIVTPKRTGGGSAHTMTQTSNRFFDEVARLMNDAAGVAQGVRREFDTLFRTQAERTREVATNMNVPQRRNEPRSAPTAPTPHKRRAGQQLFVYEGGRKIYKTADAKKEKGS